MTPIQQLQELLAQAIADESFEEGVDIDDSAEGALVPGAISFTVDECQAGFKGLTDKPMFETNIVLGEMEDSHFHRIERSGAWLVYTVYETSSTQGCLNAHGHALQCKAGSPEQKLFVAEALKQVTSAAMGPLQSVLADIRKLGARVNQTELLEHVMDQVADTAEA